MRIYTGLKNDYNKKAAHGISESTMRRKEQKSVVAGKEKVDKEKEERKKVCGCEI